MDYKKLILKTVIVQNNYNGNPVPLRNILLVLEVNGITDVDYVKSLIADLVNDKKIYETDGGFLPII